MSTFTKLTLGCAILFLAACTSITPMEQQFSGYLDDYSQLTPVETDDGSDALRWLSPDLAQRKFTRLWVKPIEFYPEPTSSEQVSAQRLNEISRFMTATLREELAKDFELTTQPGPETAVLQFALTGVETPTEGLKPRNIIPVSLLISGISYAAGERDHIVVVYMEGETSDSITGQVLARGVRQAVGGRLKDDEEQLEVEHLKAYLRDWALDIAALTRNLKRE